MNCWICGQAMEEDDYNYCDMCPDCLEDATDCPEDAN